MINTDNLNDTLAHFANYEGNNMDETTRKPRQLDSTEAHEIATSRSNCEDSRKLGCERIWAARFKGFRLAFAIAASSAIVIVSLTFLALIGTRGPSFEERYDALQIGIDEKEVMRLMPGINEVEIRAVPFFFDRSSNTERRLVTGDKILIWSDRTTTVYVGLIKGKLISKHCSIKGL